MALESLFENNDLDAVVFFHLPTIRYLCDFSGSDGVLVAFRKQTFFLTDSRYTVQAREQVRADEIIEYRSQLPAVIDCLNRQGCRRVGFEAATLAYATWDKLRKESADRWIWIPLDEPLQQLRRRKRDAEVDKLRQAAALAARGFEQIIDLIRPGAIEREIALELEFALKRLGADEKAFDFIVASGLRGAMPHGIASDKAIVSGELVTIDYGVVKDGYHSDETVTLAVGEISSDLRRIYDIVLAAHDAAIDQLRPGMGLRELDAVARELIAAEGYGDYFGHGLGHGVGLEIHEYPAVSPRARGLVEPGMVLTIEPGIYVPGLGGVRIEDTLLVTDSGNEILTRLPKGFRTLG